MERGHKYSARFWVGSAGWKLLHLTEIAAMKRDFQAAELTYDIPCNNPCKAVLGKPLPPAKKPRSANGRNRNPARRAGRSMCGQHDQRAVSTYGGASPRADRIAGMNKRKAAT